jgi:hypothetical protein
VQAGKRRQAAVQHSQMAVCRPGPQRRPRRPLAHPTDPTDPTSRPPAGTQQHTTAQLNTDAVANQTRSCPVGLARYGRSFF